MYSSLFPASKLRYHKFDENVDISLRTPSNSVHMYIRISVFYRRFPGTKMKRQSIAASIRMIHIKQKSARLLRMVL
jgi:hypothetical protein